ncbi:MAG TPA: glycosyltransferase family 9 protein [Stellaceae bacterium]|jgi:ADP-heptose:LPS heptosyltransferase
MTFLPILRASAFLPGTPLHAFFAWNETRRATDRRYRVACDIHCLRYGWGDDICVAHLAGQALGLRRSGGQIVANAHAVAGARQFIAGAAGCSAVIAARRVLEALQSAIGSAEIERHAAVFRAFEELEKHVELDAISRLRSQPKAGSPPSRKHRILIVKLGALGDFVQALGPVPQIRRHHADDHLTLLTTRRYAEIAHRTGLFDAVLVDRRPRMFDLPGWLALRRTLRGGNFDRVYDFQTSDRSNIYFWLLRPGRRAQWSGTAWRCSHPHANLGRDRQHTMDRQAEQLLMAGIYPVLLMPRLPSVGVLPTVLAGRRFVLLIPGSSPRRPAKRWPAQRFGELARQLARAGYVPVVVGVSSEQAIGRAIGAACPEAVDLVGRTDLAGLAALAQAAALTIGNDTGASHVAAAAGNPVVVLFSRASSPDLCAPRGAAVRVLIEPDLSMLSVASVLAAGLSGLAPAETSAATR